MKSILFSSSLLFLLIMPWRPMLSKILVYAFSEQKGFYHLKTNLKVTVSITQIPGIQSVYLEERQNIIILPFISQKTCIFNKCYPSELLGKGLCKLALDHMPIKPNKSC